jgi:hypothetical protein
MPSRTWTRRDVPVANDPVIKPASLYEALRDLYRRNQIDEPTLHKMTICLGYEVALSGDLEGATSVLQTVPLEYFENELEKQINSDVDYKDVVLGMAQILVNAGIASLGERLVPNVPAAKA